tara:strand:- start:23 stop:952 length:930 start_codon:yes stop_codon:yes gene_type:complete
MGINILYCFDENYNLQALTSMNSLLDEVSEKVDIYIIHNNPDSFNSLSNNIESHKNTRSITITKFEKENLNFPNVANSHVSEATYYRLFIERLLPNSLDNVLYLDADIICIADPIKEIKENFNNLSNTKKTVASVFENFSPMEIKELETRLNINANNYFNAGVMFIDLEKWRKKSIESLSIEIIKEKNKELKFWDQDILNIIFNDDVFEISNSLNYIINIEKQTTIPTATRFIHYAGSFKPWTVRGAIEKNSIHYMNQFRKLGLGKFHLTHSWKVSSISYLIKSILSLKIKNTRYPFSFILKVIRTLLK